MEQTLVSKEFSGTVLENNGEYEIVRIERDPAPTPANLALGLAQQLSEAHGRILELEEELREALEFRELVQQLLKSRGAPAELSPQAQVGWLWALLPEGR